MEFPFTPDFNCSIFEDGGGKDFDEDGAPDLLLSDHHSNREPPPSRAIVLFGGNLEEKAAPLGEVRDLMQITNYATSEDDTAMRYFPNLSFGGDVNGDRHEDLVLAADRTILIYYNPLGSERIQRDFVRGDANGDGEVNLSDAISTLEYLFLGGKAPGCLDAADSDDDGALNITDPVSLLGWLFLGSAAPPPPNQCGADPREDPLDCRESPCP